MTLMSIKPNRFAKVNFLNDFDRVANDFFDLKPGVAAPTFKTGVNVTEGPEDYKLQVAAPGLEREDFHIELDKDVLNISFETEIQEVEGEAVRRREFGDYQFQRSFRLADTIDKESIDARYDKGILTVVLPKKEEAKDKPARKIAIS